jgi:N2,N2-dimethylguanosine tRNA methyltransferase
VQSRSRCSSYCDGISAICVSAVAKTFTPKMRGVLLGKLPVGRLASFSSNRISKVLYRNTSSINSADKSDKIRIETSSSSSVRPETEYIDIKEGKASMVYAKDKAVFYNKVQIFNRDFSILVLRHFAEFRQKELTAKYEDRMRRYAGLNQQGEVAPLNRCFNSFDTTFSCTVHHQLNLWISCASL